jgi:hypothetical protein
MRKTRKKQQQKMTQQKLLTAAAAGEHARITALTQSPHKNSPAEHAVLSILATSG